MMRTVLYLRLSDEDRNKLSKKELSESIKNQEKILRHYAKEQNWDIIGVYQDEDYSGADRDRPNFNKMIQECKNGKVDIVLVKSQARFARDIELIDKYVHNLFYEWNVRFMTYLEKIDNTRKETKKTSQITSMVDEWYIEDTSINIRETLKVKRENGEFTGSFVPYGYKRDPFKKNHLIIDATAAIIIKRIYFEYSNGLGLQTIANKLNQEKILSPLEYKRLNGSKLQIPITKRLENFSSIKQTGYYKIDIRFPATKISNIFTYHYLTPSNPNMKIILTKSNTFQIKFYYTRNKIQEKSFHKEDWVFLKVGDNIPNDCTCIASYINAKESIEPISYQFEIFLKENKNNVEHFFISHHYNNQSKVNLDCQINIRKKYKWTSQTIKKILSNEIYIGNLIQFKSTHVSYKNHTIIKNNPSEWIRVNNTHSPIIDSTTWHSIQNHLKEKKRSNKIGNYHPLSNKVFCSCCNRSFIKCGKEGKYLCCKNKKEKWINCINKKYINEKDLHEFLLKRINDFIAEYYDKKILDSLDKDSNTNQDPKNILEIELLQKEIEEKKNYFRNLYENYINKLLNVEEFISLKEKYPDEIENLQNQIKILEKENLNKKKISHQISKIRFNNLNPRFINLFIYKIYIGIYDEKTNTREIKIIWNL